MSRIQKSELLAYVDAAANLANCLNSNIVNDEGAITYDTVLALNEFVKAAKAIEHVTDPLQADRVRLN